MRVDVTLDIDTYKTPGNYFWDGGTHSMPNCPTTGNFTLQVLKKGAYANQILIDNNSNIFYRVEYSSGWQTWRKLSGTQA